MVYNFLAIRTTTDTGWAGGKMRICGF